MKIQSKIILVLVTISLLAVTVSAVILFIQGEKALTERVREQLESIAVLKESQLNNFVKAGIRDVEEIAGLKPIQSYLIRLYTVALPSEKEKEEILELLNLKLGYTEFTEIFVIARDGRVELSTDLGQIGKRRERERIFVQGKEGTFVQNFYYDVTLGQLAITISSPIRDEKGNVVGVAAGRVRMPGISELMTERSGLGKTGETYLVNKFNFAVSELMKEKGAVLTRTIYTETVKDCLQGNRSFSRYKNYAGDEVLGLYKFIPEREVCLLAEIQREEAVEPVRRFRDIIVLVSLGIIVLVAILGFLFSRIITKPIIVLRDTALEIREGKLGARAEIRSRDEIGQLAASFNAMASHLEEYAKGLEEKIKERTGELEKARVSLAEALAISDKARKEAEEAKVVLEEKVEELEALHKLSIGRELKMIELKEEIKKLKETPAL